MHSYIKKSLCPLILLFTLALAMPAYAKTENIEKSFPVNKGGTLVIECDLGSINVETSSGDEVSVSVNKRAYKQSQLNSFKVRMEQKGNDVYVKAKNRQNNSVEVLFSVEVPREYNVVLKTDMGYINVADIKGNVDAHTSRGNIKVTDVGGELKANAKGGEIHLENTL